MLLYMIWYPENVKNLMILIIILSMSICLLRTKSESEMETRELFDSRTIRAWKVSKSFRIRLDMQCVDLYSECFVF